MSGVATVQRPRDTANPRESLHKDGPDLFRNDVKLRIINRVPELQEQSPSLGCFSGGEVVDGCMP
jgi:hypothetical protein